MRWFLAGVVMACAFAQQQPPPKTQPPADQKAAQPKEEEPPEEDESLKPKVYALNPVEAQKQVTAGDYYFKKGKYPPAKSRYTEATKWDPGSAEAFYKLGEADEKLGDRKGARAAFSQCASLAGDAKLTAEARKRLAKLSGK